MGKVKERQCPLCLEVRKPSHSHIFPEFFFEHTYDESGSYISVSAHPHHRPRPFQKGPREYLLCQSCEAQLSGYETYSARLLREVLAVDVAGRPGIELPDYDYEKLKLFGLSLTWRAHVCTLHGFRDVNLGPVAEDMRRMLRAEDPGPPERFPFAIIRLEGAPKAKSVVTMPAKTRFAGHHAYFFVAFGFHWMMVTSRRAYNIPEAHPLVGYSKELKIAVLRTTDQAFISDVRKWMPNIEAA